MEGARALSSCSARIATAIVCVCARMCRWPEQRATGGGRTGAGGLCHTALPRRAARPGGVDPRARRSGERAAAARIGALAHRLIQVDLPHAAVAAARRRPALAPGRLWRRRWRWRRRQRRRRRRSQSSGRCCFLWRGRQPGAPVAIARAMCAISVLDPSDGWGAVPIARE